jgi:hypothetical protein
LASLLANTHLTKTMKKEDRGSAKNAASNIPQVIMRLYLYWNGQLLQGYVATLVAHLSTTHSQTGAPRKGEKPPPFQWTLEIQKAFDQMKALMSADVLCAYPDHNKPFHIFTDASDYQLGACIMQEGKPVAYYSKKLNNTQMNYTTINRELLCVVATLRKFCSMLLGAELHVYTDHKHILSIGDSSQQCLFWISYVDEYGPELLMRKAFSRLSCSNVSSPLVGKKAAIVDSNSESGNRNKSSHFLQMDDRDITDCLMNLPCFASRKKKEGRPAKLRKCSETILDEQTNPSCRLTSMIPL